MEDRQHLPQPRHCPPDRDCRRWAIDPREGSEDVEHHSDDEAREARVAAWSWLQAAALAVRSGSSISEIELPHPDPDRASISTGLVDPTTVWLLAATAQRSGASAPGHYLGFVLQELGGRWLGLAGFFLPHCPLCDPEASEAESVITAWFQQLGILPMPPGDLPPGLHPRAGWFDPDRILFAGPLVDAPDLDWEWQTGTPRPRTADAILLRVGPVYSGLRGLVLLEHPAQDYLRLRELLHPEASEVRAWSWRGGSHAALAALAGAPDALRVQKADSPAEIRGDGWSVARDPSGQRRMARSKRTAWATLPHATSITLIRAGRALRSSELEQLWDDN